MQLLLIAQEGSSQLISAFKHNPTFMVMNLCTSAVVLAIVIERFWFQMSRYRVNSKEFFAQIKKLVAAGNIDRAIKLCNAADKAALFKTFTKILAQRRGLMATFMAKWNDEYPGQSGHIHLSLMGTVSGLIAVFAAIAAPGLSQADKQSMLSNGIAEAMYNTALGLGIAVFCMITHIILHTRAKAIQHDLETTMERTFNLLTLQQRAA